jgi:predicted PurR-regulated permease PerM
LPSEKEKLEILVRLKYQLNEKFDRFMEIDSVSGKGNALYNLVSRDLEPLRKSLNEYLELSPKQSAEFLDFCGKPLGPDKISEKYYQFYLANIKGMQTSDGGRWDDDWDFGKTNNKKEDHSTFLKLLIHTLTTWFLFPVVFIFFFLYKGEIKKFFIRLVPNRYFELSLAVFEEVNTAIGKYLRGLALQSLLVGLAMAIGLRLVGIPMQMAFLIGTLCGLLTVVPFFGPLMALSFGLCYSIIAETIFPLLPFVTLENFTAAVIGVNIAVAILQSFVIQPIVLGGNVSLHPLAVILGVSSASLIFGMTAVLLAIPLIVVIKVIVQHIFRGLRDYRII